MRGSAKLIRPLRGNAVPSASTTVTSYAVLAGSTSAPEATPARQPQLLIFGHIELHPDRIDLRDRREQCLVRRNETAFGLDRSAGKPGYRRNDACIAEAQPRLVELRLC
jgi:hypothetical protein